MAKSGTKTKRRRRMFFLGLTSIIVIVVTTFTIGKYWVEIYDKYQEKKRLEKQLISLKNKEKKLKVDANKLQDPDYIARYAREKYLYSKDGEFILKIPEE
ncbi:MAG TPA: septum formation initiator family protein [Candidatus Faecimonas gallistercoris]|nr:septum formation initiator family protein [Candidatus Faecimonas gallistercoris]